MTNLEAQKRITEASDNFLKLDLNTRDFMITAYRLGYGDGRNEMQDILIESYKDQKSVLEQVADTLSTIPGSGYEGIKP